MKKSNIIMYVSCLNEMCNFNSKLIVTVSMEVNSVKDLNNLALLSLSLSLSRPFLFLLFKVIISFLFFVQTRIGRLQEKQTAANKP